MNNPKNNRRVEEELEQDKVFEYYARVQHFYDNYKNSIIGAAVAVIIIIVGAIGYYYYNQKQNAKAEQLMGNVSKYYLSGKYKEALHGSNADFTVGYQQIIDNYSGTDAGNLARYYAAVCEYNLGNTQKALNYMEDYEIPDGFLGVAPVSFKAVLLADAGNYNQAAKTYVKAAEWDKNDSTTPYNYLQAAQSYHEAGNNSKAKSYAQKIIDSYPDSQQATDSEKLLGMLASTGQR